MPAIKEQAVPVRGMKQTCSRYHAKSSAENDPIAARLIKSSHSTQLRN